MSLISELKRLPDKARACYLPVRAVKVLLSEERVRLAVMERLQCPGEPKKWAGLSPTDMLSLIDKQISHYTSTRESTWHQVHPVEVLAASILDCVEPLHGKRLLPLKYVSPLLHAVKQESDLTIPVASWCLRNSFRTFVEVPIGNKRIDVVGYKPKKLLSASATLGIELKNDSRELKRGFEQLATFAPYCTHLYLAMTTDAAIRHLWDHWGGRGTQRFDSSALSSKLASIGAGLLLVEGSEVVEVHSPAVRTINPSRAQELQATLGLPTARECRLD